MADKTQARRLFLGCFMALVATAFGFVVRGAVLEDWAVQFGLSEEQKGIIQGVGLYPFAISIILFSLIIDRIGYGTAMVFAFVGHIVSTVLTIFAPNFVVLYIATFIYALANGTVEAVINPVVATIYKDNKTHWLNILHAGWPGGLVLAGLLAIAVSIAGGSLGAALPGHLWQWQMGILLVPILIYGALLFALRFPTQERVEAGVSYRKMLGEFGWGSAYIVSFLLIMAVSQVLTVAEIPPIDWRYALLAAIVPAVLFAIFIPSFGRPIFVFLLLVMFLLATTELGTDGWIQDIMRSVLNDPTKGTLFLVYTASIMFVLRFFAGPIVHRISPLGLLAACSAIAAVGLFWLGNAGASVGMLFLAATLYGVG
ncbi:MAG: MFS transporter [Pirellulales bacterium]